MESFTAQTGERGMKNKVYVNPNFKRSMHVNPNFSHLFTEYSPSNKNRIFVNPSFIRLPCIYETERTVELENISKDSLVSRTQKVSHIVVSNSRYSLVRHRDSENMAAVTEQSKQMQTIKVNKYKSVSLSDVKKSLENTEFDLSEKKTTLGSKRADSTLKDINKANKIFGPYARAYESRFKIKKINKNTRSLPSVSVNNVYRKNNSISQVDPKHSKIKLNRKLLKKNNIPCPLFRKYGKCLRLIHGHCGFLHDMKHVNVCRLFIKGMCHNNQCLLSHDLSLQKMPTCYFFLKGMCTKDKCPYLHVKLNEKAKNCVDFLKGYCEKGYDCMDRHVDMCPNFASKLTCFKKLCPYPHKITEVDKLKKISDLIKTKKQSRKSSNLQKINCKETENSAKNSYRETTDSRYYKDMDSASTSDICNKIKPIRCKLDTLPSFIAL